MYTVQLSFSVRSNSTLPTYLPTYLLCKASSPLRRSWMLHGLSPSPSPSSSPFHMHMKIKTQISAKSDLAPPSPLSLYLSPFPLFPSFPCRHHIPRTRLFSFLLFDRWMGCCIYALFYLPAHIDGALFCWDCDYDCEGAGVRGGGMM